MKEIAIPLLNTKFEINSIACNLFGIDIWWYAIFIVLAFIIGIAFCKKDDGKYGVKFDDILELMIFLIPISLIGARIFYIFFNWKYYSNNLLEILNIRNGGLAIYGGIILGVITTYIFCKIKRIKLLNLTDYIIPYLDLGQVIGRWGNFFNVEAYGKITNSILRMGVIENEKYIEVHPTFLYESIFCFGIFLLLFFVKNKRKYVGQLTFIYLTLYGIIRSIIEPLRIDSLMIGKFRISQVISIILFLVFGSILVLKKLKGKRVNE